MHTPLTDHTRYILDKKQFSIMKKGVIIVNTARGAVVNTTNLLPFLKNGIVAGYAADVYENEQGIFFYDHSRSKLTDAVLQSLLERDNVLITPHQAFATYEALTNIAETTFYNLLEWNSGLVPDYELTKTARFLSA
jgi:D-lactate dehydrogenase